MLQNHQASYFYNIWKNGIKKTTKSLFYTWIQTINLNWIKGKKMMKSKGVNRIKKKKGWLFVKISHLWSLSRPEGKAGSRSCCRLDQQQAEGSLSVCLMMRGLSAKRDDFCLDVRIGMRASLSLVAWGQRWRFRHTRLIVWFDTMSYVH